MYVHTLLWSVYLKSMKSSTGKKKENVLEIPSLIVSLKWHAWLIQQSPPPSPTSHLFHFPTPSGIKHLNLDQPFPRYWMRAATPVLLLWLKFLKKNLHIFCHADKNGVHFLSACTFSITPPWLLPFLVTSGYFKWWQTFLSLPILYTLGTIKWSRL